MLRKSNYKGKGFNLQEAVAMAQVRTDIDRIYATFYIGASREAIENGDVIETKTIAYPWDRKSDPVKFAYEKAKGQKTYEVENENGEKENVTEYGLFYGWDDME